MRSSLCNRRKSHNIWLQIKTFDWNVKLYKLHCLRWICPCLSCLFPCQYLDLSMFIMFIPPVNTWICPCLSWLFPCQYPGFSMFIMFIPLSILIFGSCNFSDIYKGFHFEQTNSLNLKINFYLFLCSNCLDVIFFMN